MVAMTTELIDFPRGRPLTRADLDAMPDDGRRYELIDGLLMVSPAPRPVHQVVVGNVYMALRAARPSDIQALFAPLDVALSDDTVMQPDLLIAYRSDFTERDLPVAPLLAIEVLSPSTRAYDLLLKKDRLQRAGCRHYWVVDPDVPAVTAWTLRDGVYVETATATGAEVLSVSEPYEITLVPAALVTD
jgi:Uma2 family endonuclease